MKYVEVTSLFDGDPAYLALLSTFQFDPDFFERRLLRRPALASARRIAVFMDAREWLKLLRREAPARWLNRRYLVVPVSRSGGCFHPKLSLMASEAGGLVLCGSNNLTRSGCASNLELLNAIPWDTKSPAAGNLNVARAAFAFFERAASDAEAGVGRIAQEWIAEAGAAFPFLMAPVTQNDRASVQLVQSYTSNLWNELLQRFERDRPSEVFVMSPYHDADGDLCRRLARVLPSAKIELLVQPHVTRLLVQPLRKIKTLRLSEPSTTSRRVHAKLIAWRGRQGSGCLVGSANFTRAALDGGNVETCLIVEDSDEFVRDLFDAKLAKRSLAIDKFEPGCDDDADPEHDPTLLHIRSAVLSAASELQVRYTHHLQDLVSLRVAIRVPGEKLPRVSIPVGQRADSVEKVTLPEEAFSDAHGSLLAALVGERKTGVIESAPVWVVQEERLTYEQSLGSSSSRSRIEETGEGLPEYLDELGAREGMSAVIDYLKHLNIRYNDGSGGHVAGRTFIVRMRDPFRTDAAPDWLISRTTQVAVEEAILDFADRHLNGRLHKHARRGNVNGIPNFVDIFTTIVGVLLLYHRRGVINGTKVVGRLCTLVQVATVGNDLGVNSFVGYLRSVYDNLGRDLSVMRESCAEWRFGAEVRVALLIAQRMRFDPKEPAFDGPKPTRPKDVLPTVAGAVSRGLSGCEPSADEVRQALERYGMSPDEVALLLAELPARTI